MPLNQLKKTMIPIRKLKINKIEKPASYAYVGLGEDNSSKILKKSYNHDLYKYDDSTNTWTKLKKFPGGKRNGSICFVINNIAYVGCGQDDGDATLKIPGRYRDEVYKYIQSKDQWIEVASFPQSLRKNLIAFVLDGIAHVGLGNFGAKRFSDIYKYDIAKNAWIKAFEIRFQAKSKASILNKK